MKKTIALHVYFSMFSWGILMSSVQAQTEESIAPNKIIVKLDASVQAQWVAYQQSGQWSLSTTGEPQLDQLNQRYGVKRIRRMFPASARFEHAHRQFGLHRWYEIIFGDTLTTEVQQLLEQYQESPAITLAEPFYLRTLGEHSKSARTVAASPFSNDPDFGDQWHYHNTGQSDGTPSADIDLLAAWAIEQGDPRVIVAVIDGGIDTRHEDLRQALWVNTTEQDGSPNVDDDGNGYVDDVHGYNFGDDRGRIFANEHGTHVAGTVGAVSNNGTGVAGVAGGSGAGDGVRLMSCAVFGSGSQGGFAEAFVYAADHGAVIAQNSWGGGGESAVLEDAIQYFTQRAGYDNSSENFDQNRQIGPMAGGLVVFAAGNNNSENARMAYPASLPSVLTVAATDHDDLRSDFTNYGTWVDIAAPGSEILSTTLADTYGLLSGTSMACPQVSGVAALLVSHYQQAGLTPTHVRALLMSGAVSIDESNPRYAGKLGRGRVNAYQSFMQDQTSPPGAITDVVAQAQAHDQVRLIWMASGGDSTRGFAAHYDLRYATVPITAQNFDQATPFPTTRPPHPTGTADTIVVDGLRPTTRYYFALKTRDLLGNVSALSNTVTATTLPPPIISVQPASMAVTVEVGQTLEDTLIIANTTGRSTLSFTLATSAESDWLQFGRHPDTVAAGDAIAVVLTTDAEKLSEGIYRDTLLVDSNDPSTPRIVVPVQATVVGTPQLSVSTPEILLEEVWLTTTPTVPLTILNTGTGTLTITRLATNTAEFQIDTSSLVLPPGARHTARITFFSTALGTFEGKLTVESDDPRQPTYEISLVATVVPLPALAPEPGSLVVELAEGDTIGRTIRLHSFSADTLTWTHASATQAAWWKLTPASGLLAPGDTTTLRLSLDAKQNVGTYQQTIVFQTENDEASEISFPLTLRVTEKIIPLAISNSIPDQRLVLSDTAYRLNLAAYVNPNHNLRYTVVSEDTAVLRVATDSSTLYLSPQEVGATTVQLRIRDVFDQEVQSSFRAVVVAPNSAPEVTNAIDSVLLLDGEVRTFVLSEIFADPDQDSLTYAAESSDPVVAKVEVNNGVLTLASQAVGHATVLLSATDPAGADVTSSLQVEVAAVTATERYAALSYNLTCYPNPSTDWVAIRYEIPAAGNVRLTLHDEYGGVIHQLLAQHQAAGQYTIRYRVANLPSGVYILRLSTRQGTMMHKMVVL